MKEQLLAAAGFTGSLTASQNALAGRLAALQLAVKQQREAGGGCGGGGGGGGGGSSGRGTPAAPGDAPADGPEPFFPTMCSDICMMGDCAAE